MLQEASSGTELKLWWEDAEHCPEEQGRLAPAAGWVHWLTAWAGLSPVPKLQLEAPLGKAFSSLSYLPLVGKFLPPFQSQSWQALVCLYTDHRLIIPTVDLQNTLHLCCSWDSPSFYPVPEILGAAPSQATSFSGNPDFLLDFTLTYQYSPGKWSIDPMDNERKLDLPQTLLDIIGTSDTPPLARKPAGRNSLLTSQEKKGNRCWKCCSVHLRVFFCLLLHRGHWQTT